MKAILGSMLLLSAGSGVMGRKATASLSALTKSMSYTDGVRTTTDMNAVLTFEESTGVTVSLNSTQSQTLTSQQGTYEMCVYEYGGYGASQNFGSRVACSGNVREFSDDTLFSATLSSSTLQSGQPSSLLGRAALLEKRSVFLMPMSDRSDTLTIELQSSDGTVIDTENVAVNGATVRFDFTSAPAVGDAYKLVVTAGATGTNKYVFAEYEREDYTYFFKTLMITDYNTTVDESMRDTYSAYSALGEELTTYTSQGWTFQRYASASATPTSPTCEDVNYIVAIGTIGVASDNDGSDIGGPNPTTTNRVMCYFNDFWGNRTISGSALVSRNASTGTLKFQSAITGLECNEGETSCSHSFHFHEYGDLRGASGMDEQSPTAFGSISDAIDLPLLELDGSVTATYVENGIADTNFENIAGITLTVHDGPLTSNQTIVWSVCGLADESSCLLYGCPGAEYEVDDDDGGASTSKSPATLLLLVLSLLPIARVF